MPISATDDPALPSATDERQIAKESESATQPTTVLTVSQLAELWSVTDQCVYNWRDSGRLTCVRNNENNQAVANEVAARKEKVIAESGFKTLMAQRNVPGKFFEAALRQGKIVPNVRGPKGDRRFSLDDLDTIEQMHREATSASFEPVVVHPGTPRGRNQAEESPSSGVETQHGAAPAQTAVDAEPLRSKQAGEDDVTSCSTSFVASTRFDRREAIFRYLTQSQSPCDLPAWFWHCSDCPPFVPPVGVFRYEYGEAVFEPDTNDLWTAITCTGGYEVVDGKPRVIPADPRWGRVSSLWHAGKCCPPGYEFDNLQYDLAIEEWYAQYRRFGCGKAAVGPERRDREAAIRKYIGCGLRPCDLPGWFWDVPEMPPFVPPINTFLIHCGEQFLHKEGDEMMTWLVRSEGWEEMWTSEDPGPRIQPRPRIERLFPISGAHPSGSVPEQFLELNWRYAIAKQEWEAEWLRHRGTTKAAAASGGESSLSG